MRKVLDRGRIGIGALAIGLLDEAGGGVDAVYVSGGGVRNPTLMRAIERRLGGLPLRLVAALGVDPSSKEALAFAFLAHQTMCGLPGNVPGATGARHPVVLGHITPGGWR